MTTAEIKDSFGIRTTSTIYQDKINELTEEIKILEDKERSALALYANSNDDHAWFFENRLERITQSLKVLQQQRKNWEFKKAQLYARPDTPLKGLDLDAIKLIPCESLLPPPVHSNHATSHYKAPWRNEKSPSLVVYHKQNRWWDYGLNEGGTSIDLVMKLEDCDFKEAIKYLSK